MLSLRAALAAATSVVACSTVPVSQSGSPPVPAPAGAPAQRDDLETAARAVALAPDDAAMQYRWGAALVAAGRAAEALAPLSFAVELSPRQIGFRLALATALSQTGDGAGALKSLRDVSRLSPSRAEAERAVRLARALTDPFRGLLAEQRAALASSLASLEGENPGRALDESDALVSRLPLLPAGHLIAALAAHRLGDAERAVAELNEAAALGPALPQPHRYLAELLLRDRPDRAADEYRAAVERNPLDVEALGRLGLLQLDRLSRPAAAVDALERAAALSPDDVALQALTLRAQFMAGFPAAARQRLSAVSADHRGDAGALLRFAYALHEQRGRAPPRERDLLTQCIEQLLEAVAATDPDDGTAAHLRKVLDAG